MAPGSTASAIHPWPSDCFLIAGLADPAWRSLPGFIPGIMSVVSVVMPGLADPMYQAPTPVARQPVW